MDEEDHDGFSDVPLPDQYDELDGYTAYADTRHGVDRLVISDMQNPRAWLSSDTYHTDLQ